MRQGVTNVFTQWPRSQQTALVQFKKKKKTLCYFLNAIKHTATGGLKSVNTQHVLSDIFKDDHWSAMTLQKCLVRQANQHFSLLFLKQMILISPSGDIFSLVFSITQSRFICISDRTKWLALLWCVSRQLMLVSKTTTTIIIIRTVQQTISTISSINRIAMKRIWDFHNWRTKREAEKQRLAPTDSFFVKGCSLWAEVQSWCTFALPLFSDTHVVTHMYACPHMLQTHRLWKKLQVKTIGSQWEE